jgi:Zn-dependent alcohol dehydrogenase
MVSQLKLKMVVITGLERLTLSFDIKVIAEMTNGGVDRSVECTGSIQAMISAFECVHDVSIYPSL